jgi:hypothetical protein
MPAHRANPEPKQGAGVSADVNAVLQIEINLADAILEQGDAVFGSKGRGV